MAWLMRMVCPTSALPKGWVDLSFERGLSERVIHSTISISYSLPLLNLVLIKFTSHSLRGLSHPVLSVDKTLQERSNHLWSRPWRVKQTIELPNLP